VDKVFFKFGVNNFTQGEINMTTEPTVPENRALVEYSEETKAIVSQDPKMAGESDEVKNETMALIEALGDGHSQRQKVLGN
jgi:hypothetical protein